jgi:hypothetical protein
MPYDPAIGVENMPSEPEIVAILQRQFEEAKRQGNMAALNAVIQGAKFYHDKIRNAWPGAGDLLSELIGDMLNEQGAIREMLDNKNAGVSTGGGGGGSQRNDQLRLAMSVPLADRVRSAVGMRTTLDELIGHLEDGQRLQAGCGCGKKRIQAQAAGVREVIDWLRTAGPVGMAIATSAMAVLWSVQEGPKLVRALSDLMAGQPTTLSLTEEQLIQQAISTAQAKTVADFRAGNQSDYGLSFNPAISDWDKPIYQNPRPDTMPLGARPFADYYNPGDIDDTLVSQTWTMAETASPKDPCGYLRGQIEKQKQWYAKNSSWMNEGSGPSPELRATDMQIRSTQWIITLMERTISRHCFPVGREPWSGGDPYDVDTLSPA